MIPFKSVFERERASFPTLLARTYLAASSLGPYPCAMLADLEAYAESLSRRARSLAEWTQRWNEMHTLTEGLLEAPPGSVFLCGAATSAQAAVAASIHPVGARRRIVIGSADFHSARYMWHAQVQRGFEIVEIASGGDACGTAAFDVIDERVRIVALSLVSPRTGGLLDTAAVIARARRVGAIVMLDAYQAVGVVPVRVSELGAHVVVGGFHKWMGGGGMGLAFGYVAPGLCAELEPAYPGWLAHRTPFEFGPTFDASPTAEKFQQGAPAMEPIYTSRAGIRWVTKVGIDAIRARSLELTERLIHRAIARGLRVTTPRLPRHRGGMVCIDVPDPETVAKSLAVRGIDVDARVNAGIRIAPHACVDEDECDAVIDALYAALYKRNHTAVSIGK